MFGQFSQGLAQQLGEAVRGMHGAGAQHMHAMLQMLMQGNAEQKKTHEATVAALSSGQPPPPPPPGGAITSATQGLRPGSSTDDAPMSVAPEILSNFAQRLMHHVKPLISMEQFADERKKRAPRNLGAQLEDANKRRARCESL